MDSSPVPADFNALAAELYPGRTSLIESLNRLRPRIMPVEELAAVVPPDARLLDIGCGAGLFMGLLAASGRLHTGIGFDMSEDAIDLANRMCQRLPEGHGIQFLRLSVGDPWPEGTFDAISLIDVMHHIPPDDQMEVISMAAAKLKPGGRFIYKDMGQRPLWMASANRLHDLVVARQWIHYLPLARVRTALTDLGFRHVQEDRIGKFWYMHELLVMDAPR